ncbi:hypothetical protein [Nesterenkonia lutea]|uniref:Uncharacterized protein n=1 Tax=Nesterenkonia lutea TaxID=272919 RepID=A0ABR9JHJ4_9MICC|nr:hypothetical protein [Nesterenkonia lutea]MBE1525411.1 hypothetical protein [Nesterenkonia lutea]
MTDSGEPRSEAQRAWPARYNWILGRPDRLGAGAMMICGGGLLFNSILAMVRMFSGTGDVVEMWFNIAGALLGPFGLLYFWAGFRLRRVRSHGARSVEDWSG